MYRSIYMEMLSPSGMDALLVADEGYNAPDELWTRLKMLVCYFNSWIIYPLYLMLIVYTLLRDDGNDSTAGNNKLILVCFLVNGIQISFKLWMFQIRKEGMRSVILDHRSFRSTESLGNWATRYLEGERRRIRRVSLWLSYSVYPVIITWVLLPAFSSGSKLLPHSYPFTASTWLTYLFETYVVWINVITVVAFNRYAMVVVLFTCAQLRILGKALGRASSIDSLGPLIKDHQNLIRLCDLIRKLLSPILLVQLVSNGITLAIATFEIVELTERRRETEFRLGSLIKLMKLLNYLIIQFLELLFYCWISTCLQTANAEVGARAYSSGWYRYLEDSGGSWRQVAAMITAIMAASSRTVSLTAAYMAELDFDTFINVLRISYSYYTVLKQLAAK